MKKITVEEAKKVLEYHGYYCENLWHIDDVMNRYECSEDDAFNILDDVLQSELIMERIHDKIKEIAIDNGLTECNKNK
jgi:hypothetical protein